jgi:hypothetical protein
VVGIRHDDDVALVSPVPHAVVDGDPARPGGDDVEQRQPVRSRHEGVGEDQRRRVEFERVGQLGAEEERPVETEMVEHRPDGVAHRHNPGVAASSAGVAVMGFAAGSGDDRSRRSHPPKES